MKKLLTNSGITFVTAWITGLMTATNGPKPTATGDALKAYYSSHQHAAMLQTLCVDALAGLALIGITIGIARIASHPTRRRIQIALLAILVILVSSAAHRTMSLPRWLTTSGIASAPVLALSGLAFPLGSDALYGALYITLPLLLLWTPTISIKLSRREALA